MNRGERERRRNSASWNNGEKNDGYIGTRRARGASERNKMRDPLHRPFEKLEAVDNQFLEASTNLFLPGRRKTPGWPECQAPRPLKELIFQSSLIRRLTAILLTTPRLSKEPGFQDERMAKERAPSTG